ncbi:Glycosyl transferase family 2 [compost metagenome]
MIYASDDGSSDDTLEILRRYQVRLGESRLVLLQGPRRGFVANFLSLLKNSRINAPYFAFCDQDDIWYPDKLERALAWVRAVPAAVPALYCSRTRLIDEHDAPIGFSPLFTVPPSFTNALVQSIAGGNTMLFNMHVRDLLRETRESTPVITHDWWAYILVTGSGGSVFYDPLPCLDYRQHGGNLIGANSSLRDRVIRMKGMVAGVHRRWNEDHLRAILPLRHHLTPNSLKTLDLFARARDASLVRRLFLVLRSGVHRQTLPGNLALVAATIIKRF